MFLKIRTLKLIVLIAVFLASSVSILANNGPKRTILFLIDGFHWDAPERLELENFNRLIDEGSYFHKACLLMSYHPLSGDWAKIHNSSMPNPIMVSGSLFLTPEHKMIQEMFPRDQLTGHSANSTAYLSIDRGTNVSFIQRTNDEVAIEFAIDSLAKHDLRYLRIHLQDTGTGGWQCSTVTDDVPWKRNIWAEGSPYIKNLLEADALLGRFVEALKDMDKWDDTLFIVTSDHGQTVTGWHPPLDPEAWYTPLLFIGPDIAQGRRFEYAEHTDIIPTICEFMNIELPVKDGSGRVLTEIMASNTDYTQRDDRPTEVINHQLTEYMRYESKMLLAARDDPHLETIVRRAERRFYHLDRFLDWHKAGTIENLIAANDRVLEDMKREFYDSPASRQVHYGDRVSAMFVLDNNQPAFENELIGVRSYSEGWGLDVFGKTELGKRLTLKNFFKIEEPYILDYHSFHEIGMDTLHIGDSAGLGGVVFVVDQQRYLPKFQDSNWEIIGNGGQSVTVMVTAPIEIEGETMIAKRIMTLGADSRFIDDKVQLLGNPDIIERVMIGTGLTIFQERNMVINPAEGFAMTYGSGDVPTVADVKEIGLVLQFDPYAFDSVLDDSGNSLYLLFSPQRKGSIASIDQQLTSYWDSDHTIQNSDQMLEHLQQK